MSGSSSLILDDRLSSEEEREHLTAIFRDGLDLPITGLKLSITLPSGKIHRMTSTARGAITLPIKGERKGLARVEVEDETGQQQQVCTLDLERCKNAAIVRSTKTKVNLPLRPDQQPPPPVAPGKPAAAASNKAGEGGSWWSANGAAGKAWNRLADAKAVSGAAPTPAPSQPIVGKTLNSAGQPVAVVVGPECPNPDGLRLGSRNNRYRAAILEAAKRLGLIPQAICALIDCEAGKVLELEPHLDEKGNPLKYTKGKKKGQPICTEIRELWNANSGNPQSGAAGLTQFLASTWLGHAMKPGCYIHDQSVAEGWVRQDTTLQGGKHWVFVLADGKTTTAPYSKRSKDANVQACLAKRMDPTWSINAAADYGASNLKVLENSDFKLSALSDMDKAKMMYLMHHEGEGAGPAFISDTLGKLTGGKEGLKSKFGIQLGTGGEKKAQEKIDHAKGDIEMAYRFWLATFIDGNFKGAAKYFCSNPMAVNPLSDLLVKIGGEPIKAPPKQ